MSASFTAVCVFRIALAFVAGFVLGIERKKRGQVVGTRTLILICQSSALLSILSVAMTMIPQSAGGDASRISAGVISGIGFVGGGVIMKQGLNIKGLTSAAIIWTSSAIGLTIGAGLYIPAFVTLFVSVVALVMLERLEERFFPAVITKSFKITFEEERIDMSKLSAAIARHGFITSDINMSRNFKIGTICVQYSVKSPKIDDFSALIEDLKTLGKLSEFSVTD